MMNIMLVVLVAFMLFTRTLSVYLLHKCQWINAANILICVLFGYVGFVGVFFVITDRSDLTNELTEKQENYIYGTLLPAMFPPPVEKILNWIFD